MEYQKCPICHGRGYVDMGFYNQSMVQINTSNEKCRTCDGRGIVK